MGRLDNRLLIFAAGAMLLFLLVATSGQGYESAVTAADETTITNETWTVDQGNVTELAESNRDVVYNDTVTVYNDTGVLVEQDGNYTWYESNGTIEAESGSTTLSDGSSATVTYSFWAPTDRQLAIRDASTGIGTIGVALEYALVAAVLIGTVWYIGRIR